MKEEELLSLLELERSKELGYPLLQTCDSSRYRLLIITSLPISLEERPKLLEIRNYLHFRSFFIDYKCNKEHLLKKPIIQLLIAGAYSPIDDPPNIVSTLL